MNCIKRLQDFVDEKEHFEHLWYLGHSHNWYAQVHTSYVNDQDIFFI